MTPPRCPPPPPFDQLAHALRQMIPADAAALVIAYSGGMDSSALLHVLHMMAPPLPIKLHHIDHGIHACSLAWSKFCEKQASRYAYPITITRLNHLSAQQSNLEACARDARYAHFKKSLRANEVLLTAHHAGDQQENFFLALQRSSGPKGLGGMRFRRLFGKGFLIRPWLNIDKGLIANYVQQAGLDHIDDESNDSMRFERNFIRHEVLPGLNARWPWFDKNVRISMQLCQEHETVCQELLQFALSHWVGAKGELPISPLTNYALPTIYQILRGWLRAHGEAIPRQGLEEVWHRVALAAPSRLPLFALKRLRLRRWKNALYLWRDSAFSNGYLKTFSTCLDQNFSYRLPQNWGTIHLLHTLDPTFSGPVAHFCLPKTPSGHPLQLVLRPFSSGKNTLRSKTVTRAKPFFQALKVPYWLRDALPQLQRSDEASLVAMDWYINAQHAQQLLPIEPGRWLCWQWWNAPYERGLSSDA